VRVLAALPRSTGDFTMSFTHQFKPAHKEIKTYYEELAAYATHEVEHEGATSSAFQNLLAATCKKADWHLVPQLATRIRGKQVRPDGTLRDEFNLHHGYSAANLGMKSVAVIVERTGESGCHSNRLVRDSSAGAVYTNLWSYTS
jgi:hypothetical protein